MAKEKNLYGNWVVLAPDKTLLSYGSKKRAMWYVNRGLAEIINVNTIILNFEPRGRNSDDYTLQRKSNVCVCCGTTNINSLTKHHVIPSMYKKLFPLEYKARSSHDIVVICRECHNEYEQTYADKLKQKLADDYDAPLQITYNQNEQLKSILICRTIIKYWDEIPGDRLETLLEDFKEINGYEPISFDEMDKFIKDNENFPTVENTHSKVIVNAFSDRLMDFIVMWRQHFVDSMNPQFMPEYWDINYSDFYKNPNNLLNRDRGNYDKSCGISG